jgi:hypothetical protein
MYPLYVAIGLWKASIDLLTIDTVGWGPARATVPQGAVCEFPSLPFLSPIRARASFVSESRPTRERVGLFPEQQREYSGHKPQWSSDGPSKYLGNYRIFLQAIPQSEYAEGSLDNDVTEAPATTSDHQVIISQPAVGRYTVVVNGLFTGPYKL